jgi:hypothetical protein
MDLPSGARFSQLSLKQGQKMKFAGTIVLAICCVSTVMRPSLAAAQEDKKFPFPYVDKKGGAPRKLKDPPPPKDVTEPDPIKGAYIAVKPLPGQQQSQTGTFTIFEASGAAIYLDNSKAVGKPLKAEGAYGVPANYGTKDHIVCDAYSNGTEWWYFATDPVTVAGTDYYPVYKGENGKPPEAWTISMHVNVPVPAK